MDAKASRGISRYFETLEDPRIDRTKQHELNDIVMIAIVAVLADAESWTEVELFGKAKEQWFRRFLKLPNGIPSHDTFTRVFARLDPEQWNDCFMRWMRDLAHQMGVKTVSIDGKTLRASADAAEGRPAVHMVSAWAQEARLVLGQVTCHEKSNEITAIPELLTLLELKGCIVTIDAMGCQREIAKQIVQDGGDYILALKDNQQTLHTDAALMLAEAEDQSQKFDLDDHTTEDEGHGRREHRHYTTLKLGNETWRFAKDRWPGLKAIGRVIRQRTDKTTGKTSTETCYYLMSVAMAAKRFASAVRGHWGIENSVHWVLDVTYNEDQSRCRKDHGAANFSVLRRLTMNLLRANRERTKMTMKAQRRKIGWDLSFLDDLLQHTI